MTEERLKEIEELRIKAEVLSVMIKDETLRRIIESYNGMIEELTDAVEKLDRERRKQAGAK